MSWTVTSRYRYDHVCLSDYCRDYRDHRVRESVHVPARLFSWETGAVARSHNLERVQTTRRNPSTSRSNLFSWFQLVKIRLTIQNKTT